MNTILVFDVIILIFGIYMLYLVFWMKKNQKIHKNILAEEEMKKVKDTKGFLHFFVPKLLIFSVIVVVDGIFGLITDTILQIPYATYIELALFLIAFVWFTKILTDARTKFVK